MFVFSRLCICIIDAEYSLLTQNEITSYWPQKEVTSYVSTSKLTGNNKSKLWKHYRWAYKPKMTVISDFVCTCSFWVRCSMQFQKRQECTFWLSAHIALLIIYASFVDLLFFCFCFIVKGQQKLSSFFILLKKMAVEPEKHKDGLEKDDKAGEVSSVMSVVQNFNIIVWLDPHTL